MATALQCPACGFKHRLDAVGDTAVFPCSRCSRQLKLPSQYRNGATARPGSAASPATGTGTVGPRSAAAGTRKLGSTRSAGGQVRIPLRILAWVIAFVLGALVVRVLAKWTGFVDSNTFVDLMLDHSFSTYSRLLVLVPVWALFATLFATLFIEAPDWWARRSASTATSAAPKRRIPAAAAATAARSSGTKPIPARSEPPTTQRRVPPRTTQSAAVAGAVASESRAPRTRETLPTSDQRPRRIPRRETGS